MLEEERSRDQLDTKKGTKKFSVKRNLSKEYGNDLGFDPF